MQCIEYMYKGKQIYRKGKEKKKIFRISAGVFPRNACFKTIPKMAAVLDIPLEKIITQAAPPPHTHTQTLLEVLLKHYTLTIKRNCKFYVC